MELSPFVELINKNFGLLIESNHSTNLSAAIQERMAQKHLNNSNQYFNFLLNNSEEIQNLIDLITNNETYFFREKPHFNICVDRLIPELLANKKQNKIKIVSAGCSSGEEPYTLAIALVDKFGWDIFEIVSIIGFDISESALRSARKGEFGPHSFRDTATDMTYQEKYFQKTSKYSYQLNSSILDKVKFYSCNLSQPSFPEWLNNVDIIFYRNVSIYLSQAFKKSVFKNLCASLNEKGHLILSSTETFTHNLDGFALKEIDNRFFYTKKSELEEKTILKLPRTKPKKINPEESIKKEIKVSAKPPQASRSKETKIESPSQLFELGLQCAIKKDYEKSFSYLEALLKQEPGHVEAQNLCATIHINLQQLAKAKERCINVIKQDEWNLEARILSGIVARMEGNLKEAAKWFKSVTFIQPSCWTAHMYLAELHDLDEDFNGACREYSLALKHLDKIGADERNLSFFPLSYSQEQLVHLFEHNIEKLKQRIS